MLLRWLAAAAGHRTTFLCRWNVKEPKLSQGRELFPSDCSTPPMALGKAGACSPRQSIFPTEWSKMKQREHFEGQPPCLLSRRAGGCCGSAGRRHWQELCSTQSRARGLAAPEPEQSPGTGPRQAQPQLYVTVIRHSGTCYSRPIISIRVPPSDFAITPSPSIMGTGGALQNRSSNTSTS